MSKSYFITEKSLKYYLILFAIAVGVYSNTFQHDFVLDDEIVFNQNKFVQEGVSGIPKIIRHGFLYGYNGKNDQSYRPLVLIHLAVEKSLFGNNPKALHRINVLLYGIICCLLFYLLIQLFEEETPWITFWITLLFALHPIHTEVVASIKSIDEILHALFLILSLIKVFQYLDIGKKSYLFVSLIFYFLALLSKEMAITYIVLLPLCIWTFRDISIRKTISLTIFFGGIALLYFLIRSQVLDTLTFDEKMTVLNNGLTAATNYSDQLATTFYIFAHYIKLLVYPSPLSWDYSYPYFEIVTFSNPIVLVTIFLLALFLIVSLLKLPEKNKFAFCFLFFIISFSVVSNFFILIGSTLGERFLFFPSIAYCIFIVLIVQKLSKRLGSKSKTILPTIIMTISLLFAIKTYDRNKDWKNNNTLFESGAKATPNNSRAIAALGSMNRQLAEKSRSQQEQIQYYQKAINQYKKSIELLPSNSESHYNLGVVYMATGQNELARESFENAIKIVPNKVAALNNLGVLYFQSKNYEKAKEYFNKCLEYQPDFQKALANLGAIYHNMGDFVLAKKFYLRALAINPNDQNTRNNLNNL